ncbi:MAG: hypothetical protein CMB73_04990 [Euryarchaeota archaeon]|nr:hypothetical protein [Euryarchaeota archaeon]|tara:strand:+ start:2560 stop:2937 length:378 start_codon:yes stop_codon:yes gene_type:complete
MRNIIVDSCAWKAISMSTVNIDIELTKVFGNYSLITCQKVEFELEDIVDIKFADKKLMMQLFYRKVSVVEFEANSNHTDDQLLQLAIENEGILFTVDKRLKERGMKNKIPLLEIVQSNHLRLIEA